MRTLCRSYFGASDQYWGWERHLDLVLEWFVTQYTVTGIPQICGFSFNVCATTRTFTATMTLCYVVAWSDIFHDGCKNTGAFSSECIGLRQRKEEESSLAFDKNIRNERRTCESSPQNWESQPWSHVLFHFPLTCKLLRHTSY